MSKRVVQEASNIVAWQCRGDGVKNNLILAKENIQDLELFHLLL